MYPASLVKRFWAKVDTHGKIPPLRQGLGACWIWTASCQTSGYGTFAINARKLVRAHRFAYELMRGKIPDGFEIDHLCRVRNCVNPFHMEVVVHAENMRRSHGKISQTHCKRGHPLSGSNLVLHQGRRHCRACQSVRRAAYRLHQKV